jgi:hypothetical protein
MELGDMGMVKLRMRSDTTLGKKIRQLQFRRNRESSYSFVLVNS